MKVLFAVNNESISESIIKKYQQDYKEIISAKNVYYFNAIIKELQRDKTYDRIIISEDLQPFSNNNYDAIDKFIFEKMDNISDEATSESGNDIPIILICTDRREKAEPLLVKLFGIGVYNAILGKDRSITQVCELLARPRTKKEAKVYYHIDSEDVDYKVENEGDVSEVEIQNILNHYKKIGGNEEKYVESFDHIASQYTDSQLRLIAKFLPLNVKAVLEASSAKYQEVVSFGSSKPKSEPYTPPQLKTKTKPAKTSIFSRKKKEEPVENNEGLDLIEKNINDNKLKEPVIIPSAINVSNVRKMEPNNLSNENDAQKVEQEPIPQNINEPQGIDDMFEEVPEVVESTVNVEEPKRGRGRPKKLTAQVPKQEANEPKRGRGRPKKIVPTEIDNQETNIEETENVQEVTETQTSNNVNQNNNGSYSTTPVNLFELGDENTTENIASQNSSPMDDMILPGLDDENLFAENEILNNDFKPKANKEEPLFTNTQNEPVNEIQNQVQPEEGLYNSNTVENVNNYSESIQNTNSMFTKDKKIVAFVGTSKNGTSFLVNNVAEMLSQSGIDIAILDLTQNKNAYYIYTENEETLRKKAFSCIEDLRAGKANGIEVHKNLTVYTTLPGENESFEDYTAILQTLSKNYSLVILDCDFDTNYNYFREAQEIYLVQSLDVLTIQPLTAFLRDLKSKNILLPDKIRIVLNKVVKLRSISDKTIIGGMAYYNDPAMSFMTELFNKDTVKYCTIPFEEQTYSKYLEGLINCKITLNGYSKNFLSILKTLGDMVYPLINNRKVNYNNYQNQSNFSNSINDTLNKMKNNY